MIPKIKTNLDFNPNCNRPTIITIKSLSSFFFKNSNIIIMDSINSYQQMWTLQFYNLHTSWDSVLI